MLNQSLSISLALGLAVTASAQIGAGRINTDNLPGDGTLPPGAINLTESIIASFGDDGTGMDDFRGVARLPNGHYIVVQGPEGGLIPKKYFELDSDGSFLASIDQPFLTGAQGDLGLTDLAWDHETGSSSRLWAGRAKGIMSFDWNAVAFDPVIVPGQPIGLHVLTNYVGSDVRAAAIAEVGNLKIFVSAANKGFRIGNPDDSDTNYHVMGLPLADFPTWQNATTNINGPLGAPDQGKLGAAWDPNRGTIWWNLDTRTNNPNPNKSAVRFVEMDLDGNLTGQVIQGNREIGGIANGCEMYIDGNGNPVMVYIANMGPIDTSPIGLTADHDIMIEMHLGFQFGTSCGGNIAFQNEPFIGNTNFTVTLTDAGSNPLMAAILFRGNADAAGFQVPGINNCPLLMSLANFRNMGALPLTNGDASFVQNLPDDANLIGAEATFQWLLPTNIGVLPLDLSDAGAFRVGTNL